MTTSLSKMTEMEEAARRLSEILDDTAEWLYVCAGRACGMVQRGEARFQAAHGRLIFYCVSDRGMEVWRIRAWKKSAGEKLLLEAERRQGRERALLELIPRISATALAEEVSAQRRARSASLAHLARAQLPGATIERISLSQGTGGNQAGAFARILLKHRGTRLYVTGLLNEAQASHVDALLSSTLIWYTRQRQQSRTQLNTRLWIAVEQPCLEPLRQRLALLSHDLRQATTIYRIDEGWRSLTKIPLYELEELLATGPRARISTRRIETSREAARIIDRAPHAIDLVRTRHGETLRYHGLAFARVRRTLKQERVWFGLNPSTRRILDGNTEKEWEHLLSDLAEHRRPDATDRHHALYRQASEAWLEALLRRDITRLDPGLRLAPVHAQFRAAQEARTTPSRPVDLLALRLDGRLAVIELKVSEDREHVLQAADYWRRIEAHRRQGAIGRARLFEEAEIADGPPLVYLVAPVLRFHRSFRTLAASLRREIELYRFDICEDWRRGVRVVRRERAN